MRQFMYPLLGQRGAWLSCRRCAAAARRVHISPVQFNEPSPQEQISKWKQDLAKSESPMHHQSSFHWSQTNTHNSQSTRSSYPSRDSGQAFESKHSIPGVSNALPSGSGNGPLSNETSSHEKQEPSLPRKDQSSHETSEPPPASQPARLSVNSPQVASLPLYLRHLAASLPGAAAGRPPLKEDLLSITRSFSERLRIRFKWLTIRSYRRFRADDYSALISLAIIAIGLWLFLGTTSLVGSVLSLFNLLKLDEWVAVKLGAYLTRATGVHVVFEKADVENLIFGGDTKVTLKNVYISLGSRANRVEQFVPGIESTPLPRHPSAQHPVADGHDAAPQDSIDFARALDLYIDEFFPGDLHDAASVDEQPMLPRGSPEAVTKLAQKKHAMRDFFTQDFSQSHPQHRGLISKSLGSLLSNRMFNDVDDDISYRGAIKATQWMSWTYDLPNEEDTPSGVSLRELLGYKPLKEELLAAIRAASKSEYELQKRTHYHIHVEQLSVTLSLRHYLDSKGFVDKVFVRGIRGIIDRSHLKPFVPTGDRTTYRNKARPGDFCFEHVDVHDALVTVFQPENFRPYTISVFEGRLSRLRRHWLFYDIMSADWVSGQVDNCLFSVYRPQSLRNISEEEWRKNGWQRASRFRIDGISLDHFRSSGDDGIMSWVTSGRCDLIADYKLPLTDNEDHFFTGFVKDLVENVDQRVIDYFKSKDSSNAVGSKALSRSALEPPRKKDGDKSDPLSGVVFDMDVRFRDIKAAVPIFTPRLSYINNALIRPIIAFVNAHHTLIPVKCHFSLPLSAFDGSWTTYDVGILDIMSQQIYEALAHHVEARNNDRIHAVSRWSFKIALQYLIGMARSLAHRSYNEYKALTQE